MRIANKKEGAPAGGKAAHEALNLGQYSIPNKSGGAGEPMPYGEASAKPFHRRKSAAVKQASKFESTKKEQLRDAIRQYHGGHITTAAFKNKLTSHGVKVQGSNLTVLMRKVEAGEREGLFRDFGREIFKQVESQEIANGGDKSNIIPGRQTQFDKISNNTQWQVIQPPTDYSDNKQKY